MADDADERFIKLARFRTTNEESIARRIARGEGRLFVSLPMYSIGRTNEPYDIASDYMDAIYFSERVAAHCSSIEVREYYRNHCALLGFTLRPNDIGAFSRLLVDLSRRWFYESDDDIDASDEVDMALREEVMALEMNLVQTPLHLPELGDAYLANFLAGSYYDENQEHCDAEHPTWKWGFWRSFASDKLKTEFYTSNSYEGVWIVLHGKERTETLLAEYGGFTPSGSRLLSARSIRLDQYPHLLVTQNAAVRVPSSRIEKAMECWTNGIVRHNAPASAADLDTVEGQSREGTVFADKHDFSWAMTETGNVIVCGDDTVSFVAFTDSTDSVRLSLLREMTLQAEQAVSWLREQSGLTERLSLDWSSLDPEDFEELCIEILVQQGLFDEGRFRKHGKARSRDGGRDIEAWTRPRFDQPARKWIFQCKLITTGKALSASRVIVSDVVDQYSADGFGVMTNEVIDSTLYDKLDAISASRKISTDTWDGGRISRFIRARADLLSRFFR